MKCPVCSKEISRPLHITKSKDEAHKQYVESQKQLAVSLLKSGIPLADIQKDSRIIVVSAITDYLYENHKEELLLVGREKRNERISKANYKDGGLRKKRKVELNFLVKNGTENIDYVKCQICGLIGTHLTSHLSRVHKISTVEYQKEYPGCEIFSNEIKVNNKNRMLTNNPNNNPESIAKMKKTKAGTKNERVRKSKKQFADGERKASNNAGRGIVGIRPDLGHNCRSMWEANIARILKLKNIEYDYEPKPFPFYDNQGNLIDSYLPDFYLPKYDTYLEVKGQMDDISFKKLELFEKEGYRVIILEDTLYDWLIKRYKKQLGKRLEISGRNINTHHHLFKGEDNV